MPWPLGWGPYPLVKHLAETAGMEENLGHGPLEQAYWLCWLAGSYKYLCIYICVYISIYVYKSFFLRIAVYIHGCFIIYLSYS
jgi:hypothetical protein